MIYVKLIFSWCFPWQRVKSWQLLLDLPVEAVQVMPLVSTVVFSPNQAAAVLKIYRWNPTENQIFTRDWWKPLAVKCHVDLMFFLQFWGKRMTNHGVPMRARCILVPGYQHHGADPIWGKDPLEGRKTLQECKEECFKDWSVKSYEVAPISVPHVFCL